MTSTAAVVLAFAAAAPLVAQAPTPFATTVVGSVTNGGAGGGVFAPANALGAPGGALAVHSLGIDGSLTLGFAAPLTDGPGADLIVWENAFQVGTSFWLSFAELAFVEVSSDGVTFARFPSRYQGPDVAPGPFGNLPIGACSGLAGQHPVRATMAGADPLDVVEAGGDAFDLADLQGDPNVLNGLVDLQAITQVRLVDVVSGVSTDTNGVAILDPGAGSADIDAVAALHQQGFVAAGNPVVELEIATDGTMLLHFSDPDGVGDLDAASVRAALFGLPVDVFGLLSAMQLQSADANGFTLVQPVPLPPSLQFSLAFSLKDAAGNRSGQSRVRPTP